MKLHSIRNPFGGPSYFKTYSQSTMLDAKNHPSHGALFLAKHQLIGQGRLSDRTWHSSALDLTFTLCLDSNKVFIPAPLPLLIALAIYQVIGFELPNQQVAIKWPNDILVNEAKVSGILIQMFHNFYLIGIGVNRSSKTQLNASLNSCFNAAGLSDFKSFKVLSSKEELLNRCLSAIAQQLSNLQWHQQYNQHLFKPSNIVTYQAGDTQYSGIIKAVATDGALVLEISKTPYQVIELYAGEVVRR